MKYQNADELLRIDFEAALEKLAWSQLQGAWQLPAELARLAIAGGARSVKLRIAARQLTLEAPGASLSSATISDFASVLDHRLDAADRHRAMVDLEERDAFVLSAIACSRLRGLTLTLGGAAGLSVELTTAGDLSVVNPSASSVSDLELELDGLEMEPGRATDWLQRVGRFSNIPIELDEKRVDRGFHKPLIRKRLLVAPSGPSTGAEAATTVDSVPLHVAVAISSHGSTPRLWLLRHGIIATHATVPGYPAFEAAVEMAPVSGAIETASGRADLTSRVTSAALRERLNPYIRNLVDASTGLLIRLGREAPNLPEATRERLGRLLLAAALKRRRLSELYGVEVFPLVRREGRRLVSIDVISRLVRVEEGGACAIEAIPPGQDPRKFSLTGYGALEISRNERALLGELLQVVFSNPPVRVRQGRARRFLDWAATVVPSLQAASGTPVPESDLTDEEQTFLVQLRQAAVDSGLQRIEFRTGDGKPRADDGLLLLPRRNPTVRAALQVVDRDPAWLYPATLALMAGKELPGPELRRVWFASLDQAAALNEPGGSGTRFGSSAGG